MGVIVPSARSGFHSPARPSSRSHHDVRLLLLAFFTRRPHPFLAPLPSQALPGLYLPLPFSGKS